MFIEVSNLTKSYPVGNTRLTVLKGLDVSLERGEMVAVVGASGVGKSTLLHVLGGLDAVDSGTVRIGETMLTALSDADVVAYRNRHVGFVFQFHHLLPEFTALENAEMPMRIARRPAAERRQRAADLLHRVGLDPRLDHRPGMLSGGEQQRVAIARALVMQPTLLLADEPTGALDSEGGHEVIELFRRLHGNGQTILMVTHDDDVAAAADRIVRMRDGRIESEAEEAAAAAASVTF
jgi:ABC-type lipoprotein export system ATPase subunit